MARTPRWKLGAYDRGTKEVRLSSWKYFSDYVNQRLIDYTTYIYRGHGNSTWKLEPTADRKIKSPTSPKRLLHLQKFKLETRGRRGSNPPVLDTDDDWWALGQHHGLSTPLLDWSESPFVALYFAVTAGIQENATSIAVFAISQGSIARRNELIEANDDVKLINDRKPTVKIVRPQSDENSRLVNQRGLFTRSPNNLDLESWIRDFQPPGKRFIDLQKLIIPKSGLLDCLRYLNRMNLNHSTLFPDLTGASEFCNRHLEINNY